MTERAKKLYLSAINNREFIDEFKDAGQRVPSRILADDLEKHLFAAVYLGWLIAKYGNDYEANI